MYSELKTNEPVENKQTLIVSDCELCRFVLVMITVALLWVLYVIGAIYVIITNWFNWFAAVNFWTVIFTICTFCFPSGLRKLMIFVYLCLAVSCSVVLQQIPVDDDFSGLMTFFSCVVNFSITVVQIIIYMKDREPEIPLLTI